MNPCLWISELVHHFVGTYIGSCIPFILFFKCLCCTLRSWVHAIFWHYRTVSPRLGDIHASKCSSDNFPHTKYISPCVKNFQNYITKQHWSPIAGKRSWNGEKLWDKSVPELSLLFKPSPRDWRTTKYQSVVLRVFHSWWHIFCVWKTVIFTFDTQLSPNCNNVRKFHGPRISEWK